MPSLTVTQEALALTSAVLIGFSKTGLPGAGILAIPLMAMVLPARESTGALLPLLLVGDVIAVGWYHRHAAWPQLVRVIPWTAAGVVLGCIVLQRMTDRALQPLIGGIVIVMLLVHQVSRRHGTPQHFPSRGWFAGGTGLLAGLSTMVANAAGPVMTIYLLAMRLPKTIFIGTAAWFFLLVNAFKVPFSTALGLISRDSLWFDLTLVPCVLAGAVLGILLAQRIPERMFGILVQVLAAAAALRLLFG